MVCFGPGLVCNSLVISNAAKLQFTQMSDKLQIWAEIKKQAPSIIKAGGNPVDLLLWSQGKTLSI